MTIDEAIDFAEDINATVTFPSESKLDEEFFDNIPEWLEELKDYRDKNKMVVKADVMNIQELKDKILEAYEKGRADAYKKAKEDINEIFKCNLYCLEDMCEHNSITDVEVGACADCLYDAIDSYLDKQLKEQK